MLQSVDPSLLRRFSCVLRWREEQTPVMPQGMPGDPKVSLSGHHRQKGGTNQLHVQYTRLVPNYRQHIMRVASTCLGTRLIHVMLSYKVKSLLIHWSGHTHTSLHCVPWAWAWAWAWVVRR